MLTLATLISWILSLRYVIYASLLASTCQVHNGYQFDWAYASGQQIPVYEYTGCGYAGFYDFKHHSIFVRADLDNESRQRVIRTELCHVTQDWSKSLAEDRLDTEEWMKNEDECGHDKY